MCNHPKIGYIFWITKSSIESESYGCSEPQEPFLAKVTELKTGHPPLYVLKYLKEDGEVDNDSNTTYFCNEGDLFERRLPASVHYISQLSYLIEEKKEEIKTIERKISEYVF